MRGKSLAVLVFMFGLSQEATAAQDAGGLTPKGDRFARLKSLDVDQDGAVSAQEYTQGLQDRFAKRDANNDGVLTPDELVGGGGPGAEMRRQRLIKRYDANKDGRVTKDEFEGGRKAWFVKFDKDADGKMSRAESPAYLLRRPQAELPTLSATLDKAAARFKAMDVNGDGSVDAAELQARESEWRAFRVKRAMHRFDADGDGKVTPEEYATPSRQRFDRLDVDGDGRITASDLSPSARAAWTTGR